MAASTLSELGNESGEVVEAAFRGFVNMTSRGKRKFALLTTECARAGRTYRADQRTENFTRLASAIYFL